MFEEYFKSIDNPDFVVLKFIADEIAYYTPQTGGQEVWNR
jgi:general stress protein 26